jgi:hypothetical protein
MEELVLVRELVEDAALLLDAIDPDVLTPVVINHEEIGWSILSIPSLMIGPFRGTGVEYLALVSPEAAPVPDEYKASVDELLEVEDQRRKQRLNERTVSIGGGRPDSNPDSKAAKILRSWTLAESILFGEAIQGGGNRKMEADMVVRTKSGEVAAVVEVKSSVHGPMLGAQQQVWKKAASLGAQYAAITDGDEWRWYDVDLVKGLVSLDERPEKLKSTGQRALFNT